METLDLLFLRARGEIAREHYVDWATELLAAGRSERALATIAADPDIDFAERERALAEILPSLGYRMPRNIEDLVGILEEKMVAEYSKGKMSGVTLVTRCSQFWRLSGYASQFRIWHDLDEDIRLSDEGYGPIFYPIEKDDLEVGILNVLSKEGRIPSEA